MTKPSTRQKLRKGTAAVQRSNQELERDNYSENKAPLSIQINRDICVAADQGDLEGIFDIVRSRHRSMNLVNTCTALHRIGKAAKDSGPCYRSSFTSDEDDLIATLIQRVKADFKGICSVATADPRPQSLTTVAWSCVRLDIVDCELMQIIGDLAVRGVQRFKHFELANLLWAFAKQQIEHKAFFGVANMVVEFHTTCFTPSSLSLVSWAFATLRFKSCYELLGKMATCFANHLRQGATVSSVSISNMVWALATSGVHVEKSHLEIIGDVAAGNIENFQAHEISITLWSFATLGVFPRSLFMQVEEFIHRSPSLQVAIHGQGIANLLWAYAKARLLCADGDFMPLASECLTTLLSICECRMQQLECIEITAAIWAISVLVGQWGCHVIADRIWLKVADMARMENSALARMSSASAKRLFDSYSKFLSTDICPEAPCVALVAHLRDLCSVPYSSSCMEDGVVHNYIEMSGQCWWWSDGSASAHMSGESLSRDDATSVVSGSATCIPQQSSVSSATSSFEEPAYVECASFNAAVQRATPTDTQPVYVTLDEEFYEDFSLCIDASKPKLILLEEFMDCDDEIDQDDRHVDVVFEIHAGSVESNRFELQADIVVNGVLDRVDGFCCETGLYSLRIPCHTKGKWKLLLSAQDHCNGAESELATCTFSGKRLMRSEGDDEKTLQEASRYGSTWSTSSTRVPTQLDVVAALEAAMHTESDDDA